MKITLKAAIIGGIFVVIGAVISALIEKLPDFEKLDCEKAREAFPMIRNINSSFIDNVRLQDHCGIDINATQSAIAKDRRYSDVMSELDSVMIPLKKQFPDLENLYDDTQRELRKLLGICFQEDVSEYEFIQQRDFFQEHINEIDELLKNELADCLENQNKED